MDNQNSSPWGTCHVNTNAARYDAQADLRVCLRGNTRNAGEGGILCVQKYAEMM